MIKFYKVLAAVILSISFLLPSASQAAREVPGISCAIVPALAQALLRAHVSGREQDEDLNEKTAVQFIKHIDGSKTLLSQNDVDQVKQIVLTFLHSMRKPDCTGIDTTVKELMLKRSQEQLDYAKSVLTADYKLDENVEITLDADKRVYAKTKEDAHQRQLTQIHFQISNYLLTDMKLPEAKKQLVHRYELNVKRMSELKKSDFYDFLLNAFAAALDPHSNYLSPEATEDFRINMSLSLEGIGASLSSEDGYTVIQELISGGAAGKSKLLQPKDKIIAVGQGKSGPMENVIDMDLRDVVRLIRGRAGSTVRLTILRSKKEVERFTINLVRSKITLEDDAAKVEFMEKKVDGKKLKLARLELPGFYGDNNRELRSSYHDMLKALEKVKAAKVDGLLLDFSSNAGGLLDEAVRIGGLFIKKGNIVATKDARKDIQMLEDEDGAIQYTGPLVVLTSRLSASAAEIVAGALQDYKRAVIVGGDHTYGKGSVQAVLPLQGDFGILKVTTGIFFIPSGNSTQHRGVIADIAFPSPYSTSEIGEQYQDNSLRPEAISSFVSPEAYDDSIWTRVSSSEIEKLKTLSHVRVSKNKEFTDITKELKEMDDRKGVIKLSDLRAKEKEQSKKDKDKNGKKKAPKLLAKEKNKVQIDEAVNILTDFIQLRKQADADKH